MADVGAPGESPMQQNAPVPDPTELTTAQLFRTIGEFDKRVKQVRAGDQRFAEAEVEGLRRELDMVERHRLELKSDKEKALDTALQAAEKAVQAALAAAEKARDQQGIALQLATTKAENAFTEQLKQQSTTFTLAISNLESNLTDVKSLLREQRGLDKGQRDQIIVQRESGQDKRSGNSLAISIVGTGLAIVTTLIGVASLYFSLRP